MARTKLIWKEEHWLRVAHEARIHLAAGCTRLEAITRAQAKLPKAIQANDRQLKLKAAANNPALGNALKVLGRMNPEALAKLGLEPVYVPDSNEPYVPRGSSRLAPADYGYTRGSGVKGKLIFWTPTEAALLTRRVMNWQAAGSDAHLSRLFIEAQEIELPPERRRSRGSLGVTHLRLPETMKLGLANAELIADVPYDPAQRTYRPPAKPKPQATKELADFIESLPRKTPEPAQAPQPVLATTPPVCAPTPLAGPTAATPAPIPGALSPSLPTSPIAPAAAESFAASFAAAVVPIMESMLVAHEQVILAKVREDQQAHAQALAASMSTLLLEGLDRMLGGSPVKLPVVETPPPQAQPLQAEPQAQEQAANDAPTIKRIKVDVVGIERGHQKMLLEKRINGHMAGVDLTFVHPDQWSHYVPQEGHEVIVMTGRISHSLMGKIKKHCPTPVYAKKSLGEVAQAIDTLMAQRA